MVKTTVLMPKYALNDIKAVVAEGGYAFATQSSRDDVTYELGITYAEAAWIIQNLITPDDFSKTFETPCANELVSPLVCDVYLLWVDLDVEPFVRCDPRDGVKLYVKLGLDANDDGELCVIVSFHESKPYWAS